MDKVNESYFWTLGRSDNPERDGILDGSIWSIEGKRFRDKYMTDPLFKDYTIVYRRSPYKGSFHELGEEIARMSNPGFFKKIY